MPVVALIPLIAAGVAAAGSVAASDKAAASAKATSDATAAQAAQQQAANNAAANASLNNQATQATTGIQEQQSNFANAILTPQLLGQEQGLTGQLQQAAAGQGPNPALAQLAQTTGQNIAGQASLMAGQRGAGSNVGLMARQIGQQGAGIQQQAVGQAATLSAQQQIAARGQLQQQLAGQMGAGLQSQQAGAQTALANQQLQQQARMGAAGQGTQLTQTGMGITGNAQQLAAQQQQQALGAGLGAAGTGLAALGKLDTSTPNAGGMNEQELLASGTTPGFGATANIGKAQGGMIHEAEGGEIQEQPTYAEGGEAQAYFSSQHGGSSQTPPSQMPSDPNGPKSFVGQYLKGLKSKDMPQQAPQAAKPELRQAFAKGGKVPAMVSPGEIYLNPKKVEEVKHGKKSPLDGEKIKGKAKVSGAKNSYANDTVPKTLEEGGIVLPRSVTQSKNPHWAAHKFVQGIMAKQGLKK